jgi:hypothetical protein
MAQCCLWYQFLDCTTDEGPNLAQTPSGSRLVSVSISFETSIFSPMSAVAAPHAVSTTWSPRRTSPWASRENTITPYPKLMPREGKYHAPPIVFPCSSTIEAASSSECSRRSLCNLREPRQIPIPIPIPIRIVITHSSANFCLVSTLVRRQPSNALFAEATARSNSSSVVSGTRESSVCVLGSWTSFHLSALLSSKRPPMKFIVLPPVQLVPCQLAEMASARGRASEERPRRLKVRHERRAANIFWREGVVEVRWAIQPRGPGTGTWRLVQHRCGGQVHNQNKIHKMCTPQLRIVRQKSS